MSTIKQRLFHHVDLINIALEKGQSLHLSHSPLSVGENEFHRLSFNIIKSYTIDDGLEAFITIEETLPSSIAPIPIDTFLVSNLNTYSHISVSTMIRHQVFLSLSGQDISSNDGGVPSYSNYFLKGLGYAYEISATEEALIFKTPSQLGKTQREYHYHILLNTLTRVA